MTDKERLEGIIQMQYDGYTIWDMGEDDLVWLIEQAERLQQLEKRIADDEHFVVEILEQNKRYREALEYIQREIREAIYTPKNNKLNSDFEREFEKGKTRGLIQASDIVKKAIRKLEG